MFVLSKHNSVCLLEYYVSVYRLGVGGLTGTMYAGTRPKEGEPILIAWNSILKYIFLVSEI